MILSKYRITKALIRLRGCAGWSVHVLFAIPKDRFSPVEAHIILCQKGITSNNTMPILIERLAYLEDTRLLPGHVRLPQGCCKSHKVFVRLTKKFLPMYLSCDCHKTATRSQCRDLSLYCKAATRMLRNVLLI